jgi:hypothetical protein
MVLVKPAEGTRVSALPREGTADAVTIGELIAVGLGRAFADDHAVKNTTVSAARILNLRPWAMNDLQIGSRTKPSVATCFNARPCPQATPLNRLWMGL